jgi:ATP/maltotriose-dependent transcriptional regulator MalT
MPEGHSIFGILEIDAARLAMATGAPSEAQARLESGLKILSATPRPRPAVITALALLARCELALGHGAAARNAAERAVATAQALHTGFEHTAWIGSALLARAVVVAGQGDDAAARVALLEALPHLEQAAGPTAADTIEARALLKRLARGAAVAP